MKSICLVVIILIALTLAVPAISSANGYNREWLSGQIDWVISEIRNGNRSMHHVAAEYLRAASEMGGFPQEKLDQLRWYLREVRPRPPIADRWPRR